VRLQRHEIRRQLFGEDGGGLGEDGSGGHRGRLRRVGVGKGRSRDGENGGGGLGLRRVGGGGVRCERMEVGQEWWLFILGFGGDYFLCHGPTIPAQFRLQIELTSSQKEAFYFYF
jgi:hypothetical protein